MAVSESFLTFVLEQLDAVRDLSSRRMFGGVGIYGGEWFFAVLDNDTLFFKADETSVVKYRRRRMPAFRPDPAKPPMTGYFQVPPDVLDDRDALAAWAREAMEVAKKSKGRTKGKGRRAKGRKREK
jgi:DNA transformation protein